MPCTHCGQENVRDATFCSNCGHHLSDVHPQTPPPLTPVNISKQAQSAPHGLTSDADTADTLLAAFVGDKYDSYYREKWFADSEPHLTLDEKDRQRPKFNLAGVLLGISWLSYRKMYKTAFFVMLGMSLLDTVLINMTVTIVKNGLQIASRI